MHARRLVTLVLITYVAAGAALAEGGAGACCSGVGLCFMTTPANCAAQGGVYAGDGTTCEGPGVPLLPGLGLSFYRLDITYPGAAQLQSAYGLAVVDYGQIAAATGFTLGFVNVYTDRGWVVRNLPVDASSRYDGLSVLFDLGPYVGINDVLVHATIAPEPAVCFAGPPVTPFMVEAREHNAQGSHVERLDPVLGSVDVSDVIFVPPAARWLPQMFWQPGHPNIEQDTNQCGPAAVANSLQWLKNKYRINVPDNHQPGIGNGSLVGELDQDMNRPAHQPVASAIDFLDGKLQYLDEEGLTDEVHVKHKQRPGITWLNTDRTSGKAKSHLNSDANVSFIDWLIGEIEAGEDVELRIGWIGGGGHYICLTGAGRILGLPFITWNHDAKQGHNGNNTATNGGVSNTDGGHGFSWIIGNQIVCYIDGAFHRATIDYAVSESPIYPPARYSQYTVTFYEHDDPTTAVEDGLFKDLFDDPVWENDNTLKIDNVALAGYSKTVCVNVVFKTPQTGTPNIQIQTSSGQAPRETSSVWRDYNTNLLFTYVLPDQPAWEKIIFPSAAYKNMTNLDRLGASTTCTQVSDCNHNGVDDYDDIFNGISADWNENGVPDECDYGDCNGNGYEDVFDIAEGLADDCNENGLPDECDVADVTMDCNMNGVPDSCDTGGSGPEFVPDCNGNRVPDECDIANGTSPDANGNGIPDECEAVPPPCPGDSNCDHFVNWRDIDFFVAAMNNNVGAWLDMFPPPGPLCEFINNDVNGDGTVNWRDIDPLVDVMNTACPD